MHAHALTTEVLHDMQLELEQDMVGVGAARFHLMVAESKKRNNESETAYGSQLMKRLINPVAEAITAFIEEATSGKAGPKHRAVDFLVMVEPEVAAYLTLKNVLDCVSKTTHLQQAALKVANSLQDEVLMRRYKEADKDAHKTTMRHLKENGSQRHKRTVARLMAKRVGVVSTWKDGDKVLLGTKLIELVRTSTGLIEFQRNSVGKNDTPYFVVPSEDTLRWITKATGSFALLSPAYMPTIVPPKPWTSPTSGGYHTPELQRLSLVKTRNRAYLDELEGANPVEVYAAVNSMQDTPWVINKPVLEALRTAWTADMKIKGIPSSQKLELPVRTPEMETDEDALKEWKKNAARIYSAEGKRRSKRVQLDRTLDLADRFSAYERIYFPHTLDFRGRAYAVPMFLNPQGPDSTKAILTFADGKPLGDGVAAGWLAVHGANTYGNDKVPLEDRVSWVEDYTYFINEVARDPFGDEAFQFWTKADKPWQFLAFCYEWDGYQREGYAFVSTLPIGMDGSCNGLQHYSAALRDPVGGAAVNLVPSDTPSDIYAEVAAFVLRYVKAFACPELSDMGQPEVTSLFAKQAELWKEQGIDVPLMASRWLAFGIDRKVTKRPVMTLPYGSSQYSCREFIEDAIREKIEEGKPNLFAMSKDDAGLFKASLWLQPLVWHAIGEVVKAARVGMDWLKECAKLAAGEGLPIYWRTADGFPVMQAYRDSTSRRIKTHIEGQMVRLTIREDLETIDKRSQQQGIAPNWVHSQDATALRMFVNLAAANGLKHFALVHDSYGTVASDVDMMQSCLRRAFVNLYTDYDPLAEFRVDIAMLLSDKALEKLPPIPPKGSLDISLVEQSDFFFA